MDYQAFLNNELSKAADDQEELQLFTVHYHQAILAALQELKLCSHCATLDLTGLRAGANSLQQESFVNVAQLMQTFKKRLRDLRLLCPACRTAFQQQILVRFFEIRQR